VRGKIVIKIGKGWKLTLVNVLYLPQASLCLISVRWLTDGGISSLFHRMTCTLMHGSKTIATGTHTGRSLYSLGKSHHCIIKHTNIACAAPYLETWHKRLSHISYSSIIKMADKQLATGMPTILSTLPAICESCILGKQTKTPIPKVQEGGKAGKLLEKVFLDITGLEDLWTLAGELYALNFIDNCSDKIWVYPLKKKSDAIALLFCPEWQVKMCPPDNNEPHVGHYGR
jgi:hypothetical protein